MNSCIQTLAQYSPFIEAPFIICRPKFGTEIEFHIGLLKCPLKTPFLLDLASGETKYTREPISLAIFVSCKIRTLLGISLILFDTNDRILSLLLILLILFMLLISLMILILRVFLHLQFRPLDTSCYRLNSHDTT